MTRTRNQPLSRNATLPSDPVFEKSVNGDGPLHLAVLDDLDDADWIAAGQLAATGLMDSSFPAGAENDMAGQLAVGLDEQERAVGDEAAAGFQSLPTTIRS